MRKNGRYRETVSLQEEGKILRERMEYVVDESLKMMADVMVDMDAPEFKMVSEVYHSIGDCIRYMEAYESKVLEMDSKLDKILEKLEEK